jgi:hypothetical protein
MDINELWEHWENMRAQADHLESLMIELDNEREDAVTEMQAARAAIEAILGKIDFDWG